MEALEWSLFKSFVDNRKLSIQYIELSNKYWLKAFDGLFSLECFIYKNNPDTSDLTDFETNYKSLGNRQLNNQVGEGWRARFTAISGTATAGTASSFDYTLSEDRYITGCHVVTDGNPAQGDYVVFQVVHPIAGVLDEFCSKWYVAPGVNNFSVIPGYRARIPAGLIIRVIYNSIGATDVWFALNMMLHKPLI